jgi:hypothetical protein
MGWTSGRHIAMPLPSPVFVLSHHYWPVQPLRPQPLRPQPLRPDVWLGAVRFGNSAWDVLRFEGCQALSIAPSLSICNSIQPLSDCLSFSDTCIRRIQVKTTLAELIQQAYPIVLFLSFRVAYRLPSVVTSIYPSPAFYITPGYVLTGIHRASLSRSLLDT